MAGAQGKTVILENRRHQVFTYLFRKSMYCSRFGWITPWGDGDVGHRNAGKAGIPLELHMNSVTTLYVLPTMEI